MSTQRLGRDDARAIARILYAAHQRRQARLAAQAVDREPQPHKARGGVDA